MACNCIREGSPCFRNFESVKMKKRLPVAGRYFGNRLHNAGERHDDLTDFSRMFEPIIIAFFRRCRSAPRRRGGARFRRIKLVNSYLKNFEQNNFKKFIAPSTLSSQRPLPRPVFYKITSWRPWRSLRRDSGGMLCASTIFALFSSSEKFKCSGRLRQV
jgi:hypothetical protein